MGVIARLLEFSRLNSTIIPESGRVETAKQSRRQTQGATYSAGHGNRLQHTHNSHLHLDAYASFIALSLIRHQLVSAVLTGPHDVLCDSRHQYTKVRSISISVHTCMHANVSSSVEYRHVDVRRFVILLDAVQPYSRCVWPCPVTPSPPRSHISTYMISVHKNFVISRPCTL